MSTGKQEADAGCATMQASTSTDEAAMSEEHAMDEVNKVSC